MLTIENGVDWNKFAHPPRPRAARRLIYVGRLASHKRIGTLIGLLAALCRRAPEAGWELVVAGAGGDVEPGELHAAAEAAGVAGQVRHVLGASDAELAAELAQAGFYVSASMHEGFGLAAVEAAAAGLMPVLSDIPPFARIVRRLGGGLLFDPDDLEGAAERLAALDVDPAARIRLREAARGFGWREPAEAYLQTYRRILALHAPEVATA